MALLSLLKTTGIAMMQAADYRLGNDATKPLESVG
jgi:hypothetical protein